MQLYQSIGKKQTLVITVLEIVKTNKYCNVGPPKTQVIYQYEFNSEKNQKFELVNTKTGHTSGQAGIKVHWVYTNKQKKRRWRIF